MNDRTIPRACKAGARTVPVDRPRRAKKISGNITLSPSELAIAMELARADRVEQQIRDYTYRKANQ